MSTEEERVNRIVAAIEDTPRAVDLRSEAISLFHAGAAEHLDEIVDLAKDAAWLVLEDHPDLPKSDVRYLSTYIASQVRALATGEPAQLLLERESLPN